MENINQILGGASLIMLGVFVMCAIVVLGFQPAKKYIVFFAGLALFSMLSSTAVCCVLYMRLFCNT